MKQTKEINMDKFKKVALTALGASLAATSANAVDVSVSGGSEIGYATGSSGYTSNDASNFGAGTGVSFSASGDLDNGWTVSTTHATNNALSLTSSNITVDTGSLGKVRFNRIGAAATNAWDDVLPTAWEEANDKAHTSMRGMRVADGVSSGSLSIILPAIELGDLSLQVQGDYDPAANTGGGDPGATVARSANAGSGHAIAAKASMAGITLYGAYAEEGTTKVTDGNDGQNVMGQIVAELGSVSVGYGEWYVDEKDGGVDYSATGFGISFNVNDDLSVSYGELTDTREENSATAALDTDIQSMQIAYSMGGATLKIAETEVDNAAYVSTTAGDKEGTTMMLSLAF